MIFLFRQDFPPKVFFWTNKNHQAKTKKTKDAAALLHFCSFELEVISKLFSLPNPWVPTRSLVRRPLALQRRTQHFQLQGVFSRHETFRCGAFCGEGSRQGGEDDLGDVVFFGYG